MISPAHKVAVLLLLITVGSAAHLLAKLIVWNGGLIVGAVLIAALLVFAPWLSRHLD